MLIKRGYDERLVSIVAPSCLLLSRPVQIDAASAVGRAKASPTVDMLGLADCRSAALLWTVHGIEGVRGRASQRSTGESRATRRVPYRSTSHHITNGITNGHAEGQVETRGPTEAQPTVGGGWRPGEITSLTDLNVTKVLPGRHNPAAGNPVPPCSVPLRSQGIFRIAIFSATPCTYRTVRCGPLCVTGADARPNRFWCSTRTTLGKYRMPLCGMANTWFQ